MTHQDLSILDTLAINKIALDRLVKEKERRLITGVSKSEAFQLERKGLFPRRRQISNRSVGWLLSELVAWVHSRSVASSVQPK